MSKPNPSEPAGKISRREFLLRAGAAGALIAGSGVGGLALWQRRHFVPGFEERRGLHLPSFALAPEPLLPQMAIAHGDEHEKVIRAAVGALGGMGRFVQRGDVVVIKPRLYGCWANVERQFPP